jgi:hypothetical protein
MLTRVLSVVLFPCLAAAAAPEVPMQITMHGRLLDASDAPVDGSVSIKVSLWTDEFHPEESYRAWSDTFSATAFKGSISVTLGAGTEPLAAGDLAGPRWVGVAVNGEAEMAPRMRVSSVPFAVFAGEAARADDADTLDGLDSSAFAPAAVEGKIDTLLARLGTPTGAATIAGTLNGVASNAENAAQDAADAAADTTAIRTTLGAPPSGETVASGITHVIDTLGSPPAGQTVASRLTNVLDALGAPPAGKTVASGITEVLGTLGTPPIGKTVASGITEVLGTLGTPPIGKTVASGITEVLGTLGTPPTGSSISAEIAALKTATAPPAACPSGMTLVGPANGTNSFCIGNNPSGTPTFRRFDQSANDCVLLGRRLCRGIETAAAYGAGALSITSGYCEWVNEWPNTASGVNNWACMCNNGGGQPRPTYCGFTDTTFVYTRCCL